MTAEQGARMIRGLVVLMVGVTLLGWAVGIAARSGL